MGSPARSTDPRGLRNQAFTAESLNLVKAWIAPLNVTGKQTPMFFVFPMSLDGACYVRLSEALGDDQPFYAFQIPSKVRRPEIATSIPDIAGCLVAEFQRIHRKGDFILGGWSAGAVIALEMAQQLTRKGRPPALLASIDHAPFNTGVGINPFYPSLVNHLIRLRVLWKKTKDHEWKDFIPSASIGIVKRIRSRIVMLSSHAQRNLRSGKAPTGHHPLQKHLDAARSPEARELLKKLYKLLIEYKPAKYDGPVLLFISAEFPDFEWDRKWSVFAQNTKVCHFLGTPEDPTTHESFIRGEHVGSFARTLKEQVHLLLQRPGENQGVTSAPAISDDSFITVRAT
jgi:thioesterase domain-containing protein